MMKNYRFLILIVFAVLGGSQILLSQRKFNFDFEEYNAYMKRPQNLVFFGSQDYTRSIDSVNKISGKYSLLLESTDGVKKGAGITAAFSIPTDYEGKTIRVTGFIKTKNVKEGFAGLSLRFSGEERVTGNPPSLNSALTGTHDWKEYSLKGKLSGWIKFIYVGVVLEGKGKVWVDNLHVYIGDKEISEAPLKKLPKAETDSSFFDGSQVVIDSMGDTQKENLFILGKLWGFLKYYHPSIAQGNFNWDFELFRILPRIINVNDKEKRSEILYDWIDKLGKVEICKTCSDTILNNAKMLPDLDWLNDKSLFNDKLISQLNYIKNNRSQGEQYYVSYGNVHNADFSKEKAYSLMPFKDQGYKLLSLFRFWNMIQYFFPYKYAIGEDWNNVLKEFIPKFITAKDELGYKLVTFELVARIKDTHAQFFHSDLVIKTHKGKYVAGVLLKYIDGKPVVANFFNEKYEEKYDLKLGDIISKVDGKDVDLIKKERMPYISGSNEPVKLRELGRDLLRGNREKGVLEIIRDDKLVVVEIEREDNNIVAPLYMNAWNNTPYRFAKSKIGYIHLQSLKSDSVEKVMNLLRSAKGIVIDIRCYPQGNVMRELQKYLLNKPVPFVKFTRPEINYPGLIKWDITNNYGQNSKKAYKGKIVILINENTQSHAEFCTMAISRVPGSVIIGSTTSGADGNISTILLPGGLQTYFSGIGVYYPDGRETQRVGIIPDVEVKPTIKGIKEGRDELLEKAIEVIENAK